MTARRLAVNLMAVDDWADGAFAGVIAAARVADEMGVDRVVLPDHVLMDETAHARRDGFPYPLSVNWYEPITALAAVAAVTERVRLGMNVLIAPLRPATLLAKQLATLDAISSGRVEAAFGVGWQEEEYVAGERAFEGRFGMLEEQVRVCRAVWGSAPARHEGTRVRFKGVHARPLPPQGAGIPVHLGVAATPRGIARIAALADGWAPAPMPPDELAEAAGRVREAAGRMLHITAATTLHPYGTRRSDPGEVVAEARALWQAGADTVTVQPHAYCDSPAGLAAFLRPLLAARDAVS